MKFVDILLLETTTDLKQPIGSLVKGKWILLISSILNTIFPRLKTYTAPVSRGISFEYLSCYLYLACLILLRFRLKFLSSLCAFKVYST